MSKNCPQKGLADLLIIITTAIVLATIPLASQLVQTRQDLGKSAQESCGTCKVFVSQTCYFDGGQTCEVCPQICTGCISGDDYGCLEWREYECGTYECNCTAEQIPYECGSCQDDPNCQSEETPTEVPTPPQEPELTEELIPTEEPEQITAPQPTQVPDCMGDCLSTSGSFDECNSLCNGAPYPTSIPQPTVDPREACDSGCWTSCGYSENRWQCPSVDPRASCDNGCWTSCDYSEGIWQCPPSPRMSCDTSCWTSCDYSGDGWQCPTKPQPTAIPTITPLTVTYTPTVGSSTPEIGATTPAGATTVSYDTTGEIGIKEPWTEEKTQEALIVGGLVVGVPAVIVGSLTAPVWAPAAVGAAGTVAAASGPTLTSAGVTTAQVGAYGFAASMGVVGGAEIYENIIHDPWSQYAGYTPEESANALLATQTFETGGNTLANASAAVFTGGTAMYTAGNTIAFIDDLLSDIESQLSITSPVPPETRVYAYNSQQSNLNTNSPYPSGIRFYTNDPRKPDLTPNINNLGKPVIEIAGPTEGGILTINRKQLNVPYLTSNLAYDKELHPLYNRTGQIYVGPINFAADYNVLPIKTNSAGCVAGSCLMSGSYPSMAKELDRVLVPGGYFVYQGVANPEEILSISRRTNLQPIYSGYLYPYGPNMYGANSGVEYHEDFLIFQKSSLP